MHSSNSRTPARRRSPRHQRSNAAHYRGDTVTELREHPGFAHLLPAQPGWEQIADEVLDWALAHATGARHQASGAQ